jgi:cell division protein FtsI/penicillin-binding protein 2
VSRRQREEERVRGIFGRRALLLGLGQMGLLGYLAHRLHTLQVDEGERYATLAEENRLSARLIAPPRGRVLDRHGAVVIPHDVVTKIPAAIDLGARKEAVILDMARAPGFNIAKLREALAKSEDIH